MSVLNMGGIKFMNIDLILVKEIIINTSALIGMLLGLASIWNIIQMRRLNLEISPIVAIQDHSNEFFILLGDLSSYNSLQVSPDYMRSSGYLGIKLLNKSLFPVVIEKAGFSLRKKIIKYDRIDFSDPTLISGPSTIKRMEDRTVRFPIKLDSRESVYLMFFYTYDAATIKREGFHYVFAKTSCDEIVTANFDTLLDFMVEES